MEKDKKVYLEAEIEIEEETSSKRKAVASVIKLPEGKEKQIDLLYFSAIFVSSGENLNHAYFMPSELVSAEGTIINKALDVEHSEEEIIGHIYERAFTDKEGKPLDLEELASRETAALDNEEMHVVIAGIIYKNRFPNLAQEVAEGKWKVSMEAYYRDYDVKIGDLVVTKKEAESLGLASISDDMLGKVGKVIRDGKEIAAGAIARVLRQITFSGCGIVKNPANPPSVILETAKEKDKELDAEEVIIFDFDKLKPKVKAKEDEITNNVTSEEVEEESSDELESENSDMQYKDTVGICVNYKRRVLSKQQELMHEDWCSAYEQSCTSFSRSATDPDCLRNQTRRAAAACVEELLAERATRDKRDQLLEKVQQLLDTRQSKLDRRK